jgi:hypothetical protein
LYSSGNKALIPKNVLLPFVVHLFAPAYRAPHSCAVSGLFKNLWMYSMPELHVIFALWCQKGN